MRTGERRAAWVPLLLALAAAGCQEAGLDVSLTSNATQVALGGSATVAAVVVDQDGDPVSGVEVVFSSDAGQMDSNGTTLQTDDTGVVTDVISIDLEEPATEVVVTATATDGDISGSSSLTLPIDRRGGRP